MKNILIVSSLIGAAIMSMAAFDFLQRPLQIESLESKTNSGEVIHNEIQWFTFAEKDVWMMNQSHSGTAHPKEKWDRLAIVINKEAKTAEYFQLPSGSLVWSDDLLKQKISFKVSGSTPSIINLNTLRICGITKVASLPSSARIDSRRAIWAASTIC